MTPTIDDQIACLRRELALRERNYPGWVDSGRMSAATSRVEIARMRAALDTLVLIRRAVPQIERLLSEIAPLTDMPALRFVEGDDDVHAER